MNRSHQRNRTRDAAATASPARPPRVLVVDDEVDILRSTQLLLEGMEMEAIVLPDPDLVVEVAEGERPDVILQDLVMAGLDLPETMGRLRQNPATRGIPVIFYSADNDLPEAAARYDAIGYLTKPFTEEALRALMAVALAHRDASSASPLAPDPAQLDGAPTTGVATYFHGYMNTIAALNNYALFIGSRPSLSPDERAASQEMVRLLLELEARTDQLRQVLADLVA